ncbi:MAG: diguanylate cyclase [Myxococcales bacterium]|nr:diguanylate cyclase [Myxococcales bacterium]
MPWKNLPRPLQFYIIFLITAAAAVFFQQVHFMAAAPLTWSLILYILLSILTARINVKIPYTDVHFSMDTAFVYAILMLYGGLPAMVADSASKIINTMPHIKQQTWYKVPFNVASGLLSVFAAGQVYYLLLPNNPTYSGYLLPLACMAMAYFLVNSITVAVAISLSTGMNVIKLWVENFLWTSIGFFAALSIAVLIYLLDFTIGALAFLVSLPILGLVYFSQRVYLRQEEDAKAHINQLEAMHMSTIETLSLAIDAKDQITHGHVHRVTAYVTKLAEYLGVTAPEEMQGLRFAALVHDIGKIGIPDLLLAKPGRFTHEEMDRMRMHPVIGAQIVKAVSTDFPITDIVLCHHERWDGTGYPRRLKGEAINRFARMLAICDVYDALRSDRPYRRAMCKEKAVNIIRDERGGAFDPEITDVFLTHLEDLEAAAAEEDRRLEALTFSTPSSTDGLDVVHNYNPLELYGQISYTQQEVFLLYETAQLVGLNLPAQELAAKLMTSVGKLIPYNTAIVFLTDTAEDHLEPLYVDSRDAGAFSGFRIAFGRGMSGWVAQNGQPMRNVDPVAELGELDIADQKYRTMLSVPLRFDGRTVGVVSLYSEKKDFYQDRHQDLLIKLCSMVTPAVVGALKSEEMMSEDLIDPLTHLGNVRAMKHYFEGELIGHPRQEAYSLYLLDLRGWRQINQRYGHETGDRLLQTLVSGVTGVLRPEDRCFRCGADELAVVAHGADKQGAMALTVRLRRSITRLGVKVAGGVLSPDVAIGYASYPEDGITPEELWRVADSNLYKDQMRSAVPAKDWHNSMAPASGS